MSWSKNICGKNSNLLVVNTHLCCLCFLQTWTGCKILGYITIEPRTLSRYTQGTIVTSLMNSSFSTIYKNTQDCSWRWTLHGPISTEQAEQWRWLPTPGFWLVNSCSSVRWASSGVAGRSGVRIPSSTSSRIPDTICSAWRRFNSIYNKNDVKNRFYRMTLPSNNHEYTSIGQDQRLGIELSKGAGLCQALEKRRGVVPGPDLKKWPASKSNQGAERRLAQSGTASRWRNLVQLK